MVSQNQAGTDDTEYKSDAHRMLQTKSKPILLSIKPTTLDVAKEWLGAVNELSEEIDDEIKMHFVTQAKLAKEREQ